MIKSKRAQVDPLWRDPSGAKCIDLPIQVLLRRRDPRVPEIHPPNVPKVILVRHLRHRLLGLAYGTRFMRTGGASSHGVEAVPLPRM